MHSTPQQHTLRTNSPGKECNNTAAQNLGPQESTRQHLATAKPCPRTAQSTASWLQLLQKPAAELRKKTVVARFWMPGEC